MQWGIALWKKGSWLNHLQQNTIRHRGKWKMTPVVNTSSGIGALDMRFFIFLIGKFLSLIGLELETSHKPCPSFYHLSQASRAWHEIIFTFLLNAKSWQFPTLFEWRVRFWDIIGVTFYIKVLYQPVLETLFYTAYIIMQLQA